MASHHETERMLFTFRPNGHAAGGRRLEVTAELVEQHEAPAGAVRRSWFGQEAALTALLSKLNFPEVEIEGVLAALSTNRVATRDASASLRELKEAGFNDAR